MKILVTGASGYLGSTLCPVLEKNHTVRKFDKVLGDDITDASQVKKAGDGIDLVIHLAAIVGLHDVSRDIELARRVNVEGTDNVCSLGLRTIFGGVLGGYPEGSLVSEETPFLPETPYYQQKLEAEKIVLEASTNNLSLRFGSMYGVSPVMRWNLLVNDFVKRALSQKRIELFQAYAIRPITNIKDAIGVIEFFIDRDEGGIYNIASANLTKQELCDEIQKVTGCVIAYVEGSDPENRNYIASTTKVEALGFKFNPDLENAIREIVLKQFEEEIKELYSAGKIHAPVHLVGGNEEQVIEVFKEVRKDDWCFSTYRSHLHALLKGIPPKLVKAEIIAGHSMHLNFREYNFFTSSIAGGCLPITLGVAMAIKMKNENRKVWCFVGDMAAEMGIFHECSKYAMNHNLPIVFCIEDNGFSVETPTAEAWGLKDSVDEGEIKVLQQWGKGKIIRYWYSRAFGHQGVGKWVAF